MHSNEMLKIVLDPAMVHQSILVLRFRRPVPERQDAARCIYHSCSLLVCGAIMMTRLITAVILERLDSQDEKTQTIAVLGACKMLLLHMIDSADASAVAFVLPLGGNQTEL